MGSNPIFPAIYATIAQLAVQLTCNQEVGGSIPSGGTILSEYNEVITSPTLMGGCSVIGYLRVDKQ